MFLVTLLLLGPHALFRLANASPMGPAPSAAHNLTAQHPELAKIADPPNGAAARRTAYPYTQISAAVVSSYDIYTKVRTIAYIRAWECVSELDKRHVACPGSILRRQGQRLDLWG